MNNSSYTVAIVGAGRIASGFDSPESEHVLTHAHAVTTQPRLKLVALTDTDTAKGEIEAVKWGAAFVPNVEELFAKQVPDIVIITTPDETHTSVLLQVLAHAPKLIILEKPAIADPKDTERVEAAVAAAGIPMVVNFRRRFDDSVVTLARDLQAGVYGDVISASGLYSKGVVHTGSHMLDLARFLFGELQKSTKLAEISDWGGEPTVSGFATFEHCPQFSLMTGDERAYSVFELEIRTEKARFRFRDEGMILDTEMVIDDPLYAGYRILGPARVEATGLIGSMGELASHAVRVLDGQEESRSTFKNALMTDSACRTFL